MKKLFLVVLLFISGCSTQFTPGHYPIDQVYAMLTPKVSSLDLVMVGDAIVHSNVYRDAYHNETYDFTKMLTLMKPIIAPYDLAFYNQESILGGTSLTISNYPRFNSPFEFGDAMVNAGFNLISLANNHTNDTGKQAILNSNAYWKTKGVTVSGTYSTPEASTILNITTVNGIKVGFLAYTSSTNGLSLPAGNTFMVAMMDNNKMQADIQALRPRVDLLIVSVHVGSEYKDFPNDKQKSVAQFLAGLGVDIIIENHAHAIEPIEWIGKSLVFYALGNFLSGQNGTTQLIGLTAAIKVKKVSIGNVSETRLSDLKVDLNYNYYDSHKLNVLIYPWDKVTTALLPDKALYEAKYLKLINTYGANLTFGGVRKE